MRAVRLGDGVERTGLDYGRQIDFGSEGTFRIDRAGRVSSDVEGDLLELEMSPLRRRANIATLAQKIVIFTAVRERVRYCPAGLTRRDDFGARPQITSNRV